jgi:hypothetical protein
MDCSMETWDSEEHPQTQTLYYCGKSPQPSTDKVFYSPTLTEELYDVSPRTLEAFEKSLELEWDYLARPHSSTYVHKGNLVTFCESLPKDNVLCGIRTEGDNPFIWGGCHFLFSRDVIEKIVGSKEKWAKGAMDDQSITYIATYLEIPVTGGHSATINVMADGSYLTMVYGHGDNFRFTEFWDLNEKAAGHFFFRVKHDPDRSVDIRLMHELHRCLK